jgi:hypothetical protein
MSSTPNHASHVTSRPHGMSSMSRHVTHVTSRSHVSYYVPPQHFTSCSHVTSRPYVTPHHPRKITSLTSQKSFIDVFYHQIRNGIQGCTTRASQHVLTSRTSPRHATSPLNIRPHVTSRHVPHVMSPRHITSLTSYHVLTSRPSPCHATLRPPSHVSLMSRHFSHATSRPFRHGLPTSRQVPQATLRPPRNVTPHPIPQPEVTSLASHLPRHVTSFASSRHVPPHITSRPTPTSFHVPTSRSHVTKSSRHVPPHVTYRALRHVLLHVTSCPPSRQVPQDYTPLLGIPLTRTPPIPPAFPVRA